MGSICRDAVLPFGRRELVERDLRRVGQLRRTVIPLWEQGAVAFDAGVCEYASELGAFPEGLSSALRAVPARFEREEEMEIQKPAVEHRFNAHLVVLRDVSLGDVFPAERGAEAAFHLGSCGILTGGDGDYNRPVFRVDHCAAAKVGNGKHSIIRSRVYGFPLVQSTHRGWGVVYYAGETGHAVRGRRFN